MSEPTTYSYQLLGVYAGRLATLRTLWATDDDHARAQVGELPTGVVLVREVARASAGRNGVI